MVRGTTALCGCVWLAPKAARLAPSSPFPRPKCTKSAVMHRHTSQSACYQFQEMGHAFDFQVLFECLQYSRYYIWMFTIFTILMTKYVCVWWESEVIQDQICLRCRRKEDDKRQNRFELWVTRTHLETIEDENWQKHVWVLGENKTGRWCWYWSICSRRWWCQVTIMRRIGGYRHHYKYIHSSKLYHT